MRKDGLLFPLSYTLERACQDSNLGHPFLRYSRLRSGRPVASSWISDCTTAVGSA